MSKMNQWPRFDAISSSIVRYGVTGLLASLALITLSRVVATAQQSNSNSGKREHVATLRSTDSREGSRVAISSDQSLNNYEAYRRGDRFYVKIPAADVLRPEALRGRGFADVKAQRSADSTVLSFRLETGATARVEQHANKLDVVVTVPGGSAAVAANRTQELKRLTPADSTRAISPSNRNSAPGNVNRSAARVNSVSAVQSNLNSADQTNAIVPSTNAGVTSAPVTTLSARASPTPAPFGSASPARSAIAVASPTATSTTASTQPDFWTRLKDRAEHWLLLAQLNPIPVAVGAALLTLAIGLLLIRRRRARTMRRGRPARNEPITLKREPLSVVPSTPKAKARPRVEVAVPTAGAGVVAAAKVANDSAVPPPVPAVTTAAPKVNDRREHLNRIATETNKLLDGAAYDEKIIGSEDPETRRLVSAELLSALVGRKAARRERAQQAFIKHGYFEDATRDLRVADSDNERAAAARRLSFVHDHEATPHLIGALADPAPDVRRASVEALMELGDPAAIGPLNSLMQTENDRKVPRTLIKRAIEACAANSAEPVSDSPADQTFSHPAPQVVETEREVIEI